MECFTRPKPLHEVAASSTAFLGVHLTLKLLGPRRSRRPADPTGHPGRRVRRCAALPSSPADPAPGAAARRLPCRAGVRVRACAMLPASGSRRRGRGPHSSAVAGRGRRTVPLPAGQPHWVSRHWPQGRPAFLIYPRSHAQRVATYYSAWSTWLAGIAVNWMCAPAGPSMRRCQGASWSL